MKREIWQTVYAPRGDALERRVQAVLSTLSEERPRVGRKRMWAAVLAAAMIAASALALAAGLVLSGRMDAKTAARQALQAQYGFTPEMEAFCFTTFPTSAAVASALTILLSLNPYTFFT